MGQFLNNKEPYDKFKTVMNGTYFVDKSEILEELIPALQQEQRFFLHHPSQTFRKDSYGQYDSCFFRRLGLFVRIFISRYVHLCGYNSCKMGDKGFVD